MCDYCGCREGGPTRELHLEHEHLLVLNSILYDARAAGEDEPPEYAEYVRLLTMHAAKEEVGLFVEAKASTPMGEAIDTLCQEHTQLAEWLSGGFKGPHLYDALHLLVTHIDDEEYDLFPHIIHALDPEQWEEIELAHRAVEQAWGVDPGQHGHDHPHDHLHDHDHPHDHDHEVHS